MNRLETGNESGSIDRSSYILGMMRAFAECVANECKKLALSPPFYPEDQGRVVSEVEKLAEDQGVYLRIFLQPGDWPIPKSTVDDS